MTLTPPDITPVSIPSTIASYSPVTDIQPFTYRAGTGYTLLLEAMRDFITNTLVPWCQDNFTGLDTSWQTDITQIIAGVNTALSTQSDTVNAALSTQSTTIQTALTTQQDAVNAQLASTLAGLAGGSLTITDPLMHTAISTADSQTRELLDSLYAAKTVVDGLVTLTTTGALSIAELDTHNDARYGAKGTTGYAGSDPVVLDPVLSPSPVDVRPILPPVFPWRDGSARDTSSGDFAVNARRNLWQYTEDLSQTEYATQNATKTPTDTVKVNGITLSRFTGSNFYSSLSSNTSGLGLNLFSVGAYYLVSFYVLPMTDHDVSVIMRSLDTTGSFGHGKRILQPGKLTRISDVKVASSTSQLAAITTPSSGYATNDSTWMMLGNQSASLDCYVGGFQIEKLSDTTGKFNIAAIGDSTIQGAAANSDNIASLETVSYLESLLNTHVFNKGVGGQTTAQMDARWSTDMTPLASVTKWAIIQGGINDLAGARALADIQNNISSMHNKAVTDGMIPVHFTVTPAEEIVTVGQESVRETLNTWIKDTFPFVVDVASLVADPFNPTLLRRTPGGASGWYGDGTHYTADAKRAIAEFSAALIPWNLPQPSPYQPIPATTYTPGGIVMTSPNGTNYRVTVANGGTLTVTAI